MFKRKVRAKRYFLSPHLAPHFLQNSASRLCHPRAHLGHLGLSSLRALLVFLSP
jgi:hypothetical protein